MENQKYKVVEMFVSINGEGTKCGQLAMFVRFQGCNLKCAYCDTAWANEADVPFSWMSADEIYNEIKKSGVRNVTLTGGEPLLREGMEELIEVLLKDQDLEIEVETNGSVSIEPWANIGERLSFTMDYKLPDSGMETKMCLANFQYLQAKDTVKFVAGSIDDLKKAQKVIERHQLQGRCHVYLSPVFGKIEPVQIVEFMKEKQLNQVNLQLQLHKMIWDPNERGV